MAGKFLYLTTTGRVSGQPHEIEIWFVEAGGKYYVLSYLFEEAQWVKNILRDPRVSVRVGEKEFKAVARVLDKERDPEDWKLARSLSNRKYGWEEGLPVEIVPAS